MERGLTEQIKDFAKKEGADLVGITSCQEFLDKKTKPTDLLPRAQSVIVIAVRLLSGACSLNEKGERYHPRMYHVGAHAAGEEAKRISWKLARFIEGNGDHAVIVSTGPPLEMSERTRGLVGDLPLMHAGFKAGLGEIGRNNLLLTREFGPRVTLTAVVTTAKLEYDTPFNEKVCDKCNKCVEVCPSGALKETGEHDPLKCTRFCEPYGLGGLTRFLLKRVVGKDSEEQVAAFRDPEFWNIWQHLIVGGLYCSKCLMVCPKGEQRTNSK